MHLILFRHGVAEPRAPRMDDEGRRLTEEGASRTRRAARGLRFLGVGPEAVLSSPLVRARQTAQLACQALRFPIERLVLTDALRPERPPEEILKKVLALRAASALCVGHAPHLDLVLARAVAASARPMAALKKAGAACLELRPDGRASLCWLLEPRALRQLGR